MARMIFAVLLFLQSAHAQIDSPSALFQFIDDHPSTTLTEVLDALHPQYKQLYSLVYSSRSTMEASLEVPRIVTAYADGINDIYFGFTGAETDLSEKPIKGADVLEFLAIDPNDQLLKANQIRFTPGKATLVRNPESCRSCHGIPNTNLIRPLWDAYPDWPGVLGSSHKGNVNIRTDPFQDGESLLFNAETLPKNLNGVSSFTPQKFEDDALRKIIENLDRHGTRYRYLNSIENMNVYLLSVYAGFFGQHVFWAHKINLNRYVDSRINDLELEQPTLYQRLRKIQAGEESFGLLLGKDREEFERLFLGINDYHQGRLDRLTEMVEKYGTANDRQRFRRQKTAHLKFTSYLSGMNLGQDWLHDIQMLKLLGVDPRYLSPTLELASNTHSIPGYPGDLCNYLLGRGKLIIPPIKYFR